MSEIDGFRRVLADLIRVVDDLAAEVESGRRDLIARSSGPPRRPFEQRVDRGQAVTVLAISLGATTLINLAILGLNLKLYTEVFKEIAQQNRVRGKGDK